MIRTALFDLDGTLFNRAATVQALIEEQYDIFAADLTHIPSAAYIARVISLDAHGHGDKSALYRQIATELGLSTTLAQSLLEHFWTRYVAHSRLFPEVPDTLDALRSRGVQLGIITNGATTIQASVVRMLDLERFLNVILISEREQIRKPAPELFRRALAATGAQAAESCYIGDHPVIDVAGAAAAGLVAIWRRNSVWGSPAVPHLAINSLADILPHLDRLRPPAASHVEPLVKPMRKS